MRRDPEKCAARAVALQEVLGRQLAAEKMEAARVCAVEKRNLLLREHTVLASWRGRFEEACKRFLLSASRGQAYQADASIWLAGLDESASAGIISEPTAWWAEGEQEKYLGSLMAAETTALVAVGGIRGLPRNPAELRLLTEAAYPVAVARAGGSQLSPAYGFDPWDGSLTAPPASTEWSTPRLVAEGNGMLWNAGGRSTPGLRPLADGRWEAIVAVPRWFLEGTSDEEHLALGYGGGGERPTPRSNWDWRCAPLLNEKPRGPGFGGRW